MEDAISLARRLAAAEAAMEQVAAVVRDLRAQLLEQLDDGQEVEFEGRPLYRRMPGRRAFRSDLAAQILPPEVAAACGRTVIDGGLVKRMSPALWEGCCEVGQPYLQAVR
jgi:hypothetical protein